MEERKKITIIVNIVLILIILGMIIWIWLEESEERKIRSKSGSAYYSTEDLSAKVNVEESNKVDLEDRELSEEEPSEIKENQEEKADMKDEEQQENQGNREYTENGIEKEYKGYTVSSRLEIPAIGLKTVVLQNYSVNALNVAVTKFWGANANKIGNYCIAGHNFPSRNMFYNVKKLKIGDKLFVSDNETGKIEYEIYNIYQVLPEDVSCLSQETNGKREVTLITCTIDSEKRIIVKAREG